MLRTSHAGRKRKEEMGEKKGRTRRTTELKTLSNTSLQMHTHTHVQRTTDKPNISNIPNMQKFTENLDADEHKGGGN